MKRLLMCSLVLALLAGCWSLSNHPDTHHQTRYLPKQMDSCIFVANGSGDSSTLSSQLIQVLESHPDAIHVETFDWSHGRGQGFADHVDRENHVYQGKRLAEQITRFSAASPTTKVYLMAHSTGCAVVLAAVESLPPGSIEKIVLLAPSTPDTYDLRPALITSTRGIDSYYSSKDQLILGLGMMILGTTDPERRTAAGFSGYQMVLSKPADTILYQKLRQFPWSPSMAASGNDGNHFGSIRAGFLKNYVIPTMLK